HRFRWSRSPSHLVPQRHRLSGRRRTRPDGRRPTPDGWTPDGWTADGRPPTLWTTTPGDRTPDGWTAGSRTPNPDGWTPHTGHIGDRRRGLPAGSINHGDDARPLDAGWT